MGVDYVYREHFIGLTSTVLLRNFENESTKVTLLLYLSSLFLGRFYLPVPVRTWRLCHMCTAWNIRILSSVLRKVKHDADSCVFESGCFLLG